ncbi:hypothetical protein [Virgibacillus oceani]|uniref:Uncharacterized protein n=1 Tax=Virgibacillus oceani TaxID=1479511 RepID=A0A917HLQ1_9BACI|nr:hypothetical protein [Virgibacillus oceani]GGG83720.1 hypothetical protein GCM10011398_31620 [Virgibacillus oceani]
MIELLYDLLGEISPLYFYISIVLSMICAYRFFNMDMHNTLMDNNIYTRESHASKIQLLPKREPIGEIPEIHKWITNTTKRIDAPDDDSDNDSFSFINKEKINRGGQQCKIVLYSHFSRNIALPGLS